MSTQGLDLGQPDGARQLYARLEHAARIVCTHGMRVDLRASPDPEGCYEVTLADVIRSANLPLLTQVYLAKHELRSAAAAHGIDAPVKMAAK